MGLSAMQRIKAVYEEEYRDMLRQGKLPFRSTHSGFWGHAPFDDIHAAIKQLGLEKKDKFIDLGSGDGKVVMIASQFCKHAVGIEIDSELHQKALVLQEQLGITNAAFYNADFFNHSIHGFEHVFAYPDVPMHRGLEDKLHRELTGTYVHFGHHFHPSRMKKKKQFRVNGTAVTLYTK